MARPEQVNSTADSPAQIFTSASGNQDSIRVWRHRFLLTPIELLPKWCYTVAMERNEQIVSTNTRYPKELHNALQRLAREHRRSFNAEVMWALQHYVQQEEPGQKSVQETGPPGNVLS